MSARPHILFVTVDQWPASLTGHAGHPCVLTPTLDQLARIGLRYPRTYSECPICIPARRTMMTGTTARQHGDRSFDPALRMPAHLPTLPALLRQAGYQTIAVGKLHVYPPRDRIGFEEVHLAEEGRPHLGGLDDHDLYLADQGFAGRGFDHGMNNNDYMWRPWHLPEHCHVTNWTTWKLCREIKRRDPTRPGFWHLSYTAPHPPLIPLGSYLDIYRDAAPWTPPMGGWAVAAAQPYALRAVRDYWAHLRPHHLPGIQRAFMALCTQIDHQLRLVIGTLREEGLLDDTAILFTADHGDMLGAHGLWAKRLFYEDSARVPTILVGPKGDPRIPPGQVDRRLVGLADVLPTLLDLAGVEIPAHVEGLSMIGAARREVLVGACREDASATRMATDGRHKLIWYPCGNVVQLFDLEADPQELADLSGAPDRQEVRARLEAALVREAWGADLGWIRDGRLVGMPDRVFRPAPNRGLSGQRGHHFPPPPVAGADVVVGTPG